MCVQPIWPYSLNYEAIRQWCRADTSYFTHNWDSGRLAEGGSILFLPIQVQRRCPLPPQNVTSVKKLCWRRLHSKYQNLLGYHRPRYQTHRICLQSSTIPGCRTQSKHTISMRNPTHTINSAWCRLHSQSRQQSSDSKGTLGHFRREILPDADYIETPLFNNITVTNCDSKKYILLCAEYTANKYQNLKIW